MNDVNVIHKNEQKKKFFNIDQELFLNFRNVLILLFTSHKIFVCCLSKKNFNMHINGTSGGATQIYHKCHPCCCNLLINKMKKRYFCTKKCVPTSGRYTVIWVRTFLLNALKISSRTITWKCDFNKLSKMQSIFENQAAFTKF